MADVRPILLLSRPARGGHPAPCESPGAQGSAPLRARASTRQAGTGARAPTPGRQLQAPAERSFLVAGLLHHVRIILLPQAAHGGAAARPPPQPSPARPLPAAPATSGGRAPPGRGKARPPPRPELPPPGRPHSQRCAAESFSLFSLALQLLGSRFKHFFQESASQTWSFKRHTQYQEAWKKFNELVILHIED